MAWKVTDWNEDQEGNVGYPALEWEEEPEEEEEEDMAWKVTDWNEDQEGNVGYPALEWEEEPEEEEEEPEEPAGEHSRVRLETQSGDVIAFFAPAFKITPALKNENLNSQVMPRGRGTRIRNLLGTIHEVDVQGQFEHSDNLPPSHKDALEDIFGSLPVTPRDQVNRLKKYMAKEDSALYLFENEDEYTAHDINETDIENGIFPTVFIKELRPPRTGGHSRMEYTIKLIVGYEL